MSYDLLVWKAPQITDVDEFHARLEQFDKSGGEDGFEPSPDVTRFYDELLERHPALESYPEEAIDNVEAPWSMTPHRSDRLITMYMIWPAGEYMGPLIVELASKYRLMVYDPQGPDIYPPRTQNSRPAPAARRARDFWGALAGLIIGLAMIFIGLSTSAIGSWATIGVGILFAAFALVLLLPWLRSS